MAYDLVNDPFAQRPGPAFPTYKPEEEDSVLSKLGGIGLSGLGFVGQTLAKPGRAVRGLLAGKPEELLNLLPFSDTLGLTDPNQSVSGRDLLYHAGLTGAPQKGFEWEDIPGFGLDVLTDPLTYVNPLSPLVGGGLTKTGQAAQKAGMLPAKLGARLRGLAAGSPELTALAEGMAKPRNWAKLSPPPGVIGGPTTTLFGDTAQDVADALSKLDTHYAHLTLPPGGPHTGSMTIWGKTPAEVAQKMANMNLATNLNTQLGQVVPQLGIETAQQAGARLAPSLASQPLAGLFGSAFGPIGTGPTAQKTADLLGQLYDKAAYSKPGLALGGMFSAARNVGARPSTTEFTAKLAEDINQAMPKALREARQPYLAEAGKLSDAGQLAGSTLGDVRSAAEGGFVGPLTQEKQALADFIKQKGDEQFWQTKDAGLPLEYREGHVHRQLTPIEEQALRAGTGKTPYSVLGAENKGREDMFELFKQTDPINRLVMDPTVSGIGPQNNLLSEAKYIRTKVPQYSEVEHGQLQKMLGTYDPQGNPLLEPSLKDYLRSRSATGSATPQELAHLDRINRFNELTQIQKRSEHLADYLANLSPKYAQEGLPLFGNNVISDTMKAAESTAKKTTIAGKLTDALGTLGTDAQSAGPGAVKVTDTLRDLGFTPDSHSVLAGKMGLGPGQIHDIYVPAKEHEALTRMMTGFNEPEATKGLMGVVNTMSNAFKAGVTTWPAKYIRDFTQQVWSMFVGGHHDPSYSAWNPMGYIKPMRDAQKLFVEGEAIDGLSKVPYFASKGLSDIEASKELQAAVMAADMTGPSKAIRDTDVAGQSQHALQANIQAPGEKLPPLLPFGPDKSLLGMAVPRSKAEANPLNIRGIGSKTETQFAPKKAGDAIQGRIDDWTRGGSLVALLRQGFDLDEAIQQVKKVHYDYGALAPFEQKAMKSLVPFYSWTRQNLPAQLRLLAENPGGVTSRAIQQSERLRQKEGFLPESLQDTFALPLGGEENGTQRFLSRTGLPFEDAFSALPVGHGSVSKNVAHSLMELGSSMNPLIKGPAEFATGKQLSTGRDLEHLEPRSGRILSEAGLLSNPRDVPPLLENVLMNSPLSRLLTTVGTGMDPRKGVSGLAANLASPLRVTDVDMNRQREIEGRRMLEELLSQNPNVKQFQDFYVPKEMRGNLSQEDVALMRLQATFAKHAREAKKKLGAAK